MRADIKQQSCQTETWKTKQQSNQADGNGDVQMDDGIFKMLRKTSDFFVSMLTAESENTHYIIRCTHCALSHRLFFIYEHTVNFFRAELFQRQSVYVNVQTILIFHGTSFTL